MRDDGDVGVAQLVASFAYFLRYAAQKCDAVSAFIGEVCIGKKRADIAEGERAKERIHQRVDGDVCIGVTARSCFMFDGDAAENTGAAFY